MSWLIDWHIDWQKCSLIYWLTDILTDRWVDCLIDTLTDILTDGRVYWFIDWLIYWLTDELTDWLIDWLTDGKTNWFIDLMIDWLTYWLTDWLVHENSYPLYIDRVFSLAASGDWWLHRPVLKEGLLHPVESWLQGADVRHQRRGYHRNQGRHKLQLVLARFAIFPSRLISWLECSYTFYMNFPKVPYFSKVNT